MVPAPALVHCLSYTDNIQKISAKMRDQKRQAAIGLPLFSFHTGQRVEKAEIGQKEADMPLFVLLFRC